MQLDGQDASLSLLSCKARHGRPIAGLVDAKGLQGGAGRDEAQQAASSAAYEERRGSA